MVDFQERDTRRTLGRNGSGDGDASDGEAEIDEVREQLEERPDEADHGGDGGNGGGDEDGDDQHDDHGDADQHHQDENDDQHDDHGDSDDGHGDDDHHDQNDHDHQHDDHDHHHHHHDAEAFGAAVVTVSSSRTLADDPSGDYIVEALVEAGHDVVTRELIPDDYDDVQHTVDTLVRRRDVDVVVSTGGTGVTPDDCTVEAVRPLFEKELPGFGELFRMLSVEDIGSRVVATRATAGIADGVAVFCLPGSRDAVELGVDEIIVDEAPHLVGLAGRDEEADDAGADGATAAESRDGSPAEPDADPATGTADESGTPTEPTPDAAGEATGPDRPDRSGGGQRLGDE